VYLVRGPINRRGYDQKVFRGEPGMCGMVVVSGMLGSGRRADPQEVLFTSCQGRNIKLEYEAKPMI
jgi:hypothetical protein